MRTCKTVLYTMVKLRNDKVLENLANLKLPKDSIMVDYIFKTLRVNYLIKYRQTGYYIMTCVISN